MTEQTDWKSRLAIVSDEAGAGFRQAVEVCLPLGIRNFELRMLEGERVPYVSEESLRAVEEECQRRHLNIIGLSPGFGKVEVDEPQVEKELTQGLDDTFRLMNRLGVQRLGMFSYKREGAQSPIPEKVEALLARARTRCEKEGFELLLENVPSVWGNTGTRLAEIARATGLRVIWDPANSDASGEPCYPTGYRAVQSFIATVHLKNWDPQRKYVYLSEGVADIQGQIEALVRDGYAGRFCLENHRFDDPQSTEINTRELLGYLEKAGEDRSRLSTDSKERD
jgi:sugar phosphate isomerase/epimerase